MLLFEGGIASYNASRPLVQLEAINVIGTMCGVVRRAAELALHLRLGGREVLLIVSLG